MNSKMYILAAVLAIVVVVAGIAIYVFMGAGGDGNGNGNGNGEDVYTMGNATSLQFNLNLTAADGTSGIYKFAGRNLGTADLALRVDIEGGGTVYSYVMFAGNQTAWSNETGTWAQSDFTTNWTTWSTQFTGYVAHNEDWTTGDDDITYTDSGNSITVYDIVINPTLADSLFQPS